MVLLVGRTASLLQCSREDAVIIKYFRVVFIFFFVFRAEAFQCSPRLKDNVPFSFFRQQTQSNYGNTRYFLFSIILALASIHFAESNHTNYNMGAVLTRLLEVFWTKKLDIVVIGLENRYVSSSPSGIRYSMPTSNKLQPVAPSMYIT